MKRILSLFLLSIGCLTLQAGNIVWFDGHAHVGYVAQQSYSPVVKIALDMFSDDMRAVTGHRAEESSKGRLEIIELSTLTNKEFKKIQKRRLPYQKVIARQDAFYIGVHDGRLVVMGDNGRGTAYGILELSRLAGVSPWTWWGDVVPERKKRLETDDTFTTLQQPSVEFRGIFLNDEDWSLRPWAGGDISAETYEKVFELLLRLRANTIWPAMHEGTTPFFLKKGCKDMAQRFEMFVGSSHCEPMLRNNVGEWNPKRMGDYNFFTNRQRVLNYWQERVEDTRDINAIYTLGMRGIHDGAMEGARTMEDKVQGLSEVIAEQRKMISPSTAPSVFIPYKEVLDIYEHGVRVPDDVMLMWCDDNYGYLTRLPDSLEQQRPGGNGIYYHLSYWGRPHDYLWLSTTQPGLIYEEMSTAYDKGVRRLWIANIHDPKVAAYQLSLFLDMAWDMKGVQKEFRTARSEEREMTAPIPHHLESWLKQQFGKECGHKLAPVMQKFYELTAVRRPEFMGWSQVELDKKKYPRGLSPAGDTEFNALAFGNELERYLGEYEELRQRVDAIEKSIRPELKDAYFAAVKYPVFAAAAMATKHLEAQEARHIARKESFHNDSEALSSAARSVKALRNIHQLTKFYNEQLAGGKWRGLMSMSPRTLSVFGEVALPDQISEEEIKQYGHGEDYDTKPQTDASVVARNAADYASATEGAEVIPLLGHSMQAVALPKGGRLTYKFNTVKRGQALLHVAMIPTQPISSTARGGLTEKTEGKEGDLRFAVSIDGGEPQVFSLKESFRSEPWKLQVLRQQAVRQLQTYVGMGTHTLTIEALDDHIIVDQWMLDFDLKRQFYRFPL
ncbi:MAG: glycosyl hydrolase 115 family protein [Prevotella sp.]|nr:glycosyl hydrolase 115 family protein [Prevotella sp.]